MMRSLIILTLIFISGAMVAQKDKRTPFDKVIYENGKPFVYDNDELAQIVSIENIPIHKYLYLGATEDPTDWQKGFHRYIHYSWDFLKHQRQDSVRVVLSRSGEQFVRYYELKEKNRDAATFYHDSLITTYKIERPRYSRPNSKYGHLTSRIDSKQSAIKWIAFEHASQDLDYLEWELVNHYSYLNYKGFDYESAIDAIRHRLAGGISKRDFARQLQMLISNFGDGHTRISRSEIFFEKRQLPFKIKQKDGKFYGPHEILAIAGIPIEELYQLALDFVPKTTNGFQVYATTRLLNYIEFFLNEAGVKVGEEVEVEFTNSRKSFELLIPSARQRSDLIQDSIYNGNIGYLGIREYMSDEESFLHALDNTMTRMLSTDALIIDIRSNGGGSRAPLLTVLPYLIKKGTIANVARYRINEVEDFKPGLGYLSSRFMYPEHIDLNFWEFSDDNIDLKNFKHTVQDFKTTFFPEIIPDLKKFSDLHYLFVEPNEKYYSKKVIVLINEQCFSASDIFAAGIQLGDNVQLMGKTTGGGSGYSKTKTLPNSQLGVRHSRMFSYQPNGKMYDGQGVTPDIFYEDEDRMISKAIELLTKTE